MQWRTRHSVYALGFWVALMVVLPMSATYGAETEPGVVKTIDFTGQPAGSAVSWLRANGFELRLDANSLDPRFSDKGLELSTDRRTAGLFARKLDVTGANRIRIVWGVERYPDGAGWDSGVYRVPIAVMAAFGDQKIGSGSMFLPSAPYFIGLFLSQDATPGKAYTANHYHLGGRYFCDPCSPTAGETVTTEFDLNQAFLETFDASEVPPITGFSFQMNTKDTRGGAHSYIKRVEFLARDGDGAS